MNRYSTLCFSYFFLICFLFSIFQCNRITLYTFHLHIVLYNTFSFSAQKWFGKSFSILCVNKGKLSNLKQCGLANRFKTNTQRIVFFSLHSPATLVLQIVYNYNLSHTCIHIRQCQFYHCYHVQHLNYAADTSSNVHFLGPNTLHIYYSSSLQHYVPTIIVTASQISVLWAPW